MKANKVHLNLHPKTKKKPKQNKIIIRKENEMWLISWLLSGDEKVPLMGFNCQPLFMTNFGVMFES